MVRGFRFPDRVRCLVLLEVLDGRSYSDVATEFSMSRATVCRIRHDEQMLADLYVSSSTRMGLGEREEISRGLTTGGSFREIAVGLGRSVSTVSREVNRNGGRHMYRAYRAQAETCRRGRRPKVSVFDTNPVLRLVVENGLEMNWSPEQISARLRVDFNDEEMRVSPETIYQALYVHGRGGLRKELTKHLRTQRKARRPHHVTARNKASSGPIPNMVNIADRPAEIEDRLVPGHWEGDLILGANNKSQLGTLVERTTGFVMIVKLDTKQAVEVAARLAEQIQTLPTALTRSLTWDQGSELAAHDRFTVATGIAVYFCDPHSPWQRGSNENTNGLLRQYFPKGTDLSRHTQAELDAVADELNGRPRKRHQFLTPSEVINQTVLH